MIDSSIDGAASDLLEALPELVWAADPAGNITYVNNHWSTFTGVAFESLVGAGWLRVVHPAQRDEIAARWNADIRAGIRLSQQRVQYRRADGVYLWFRWRMMPITAADGRIVRWVGTHTELEEQLRVENALAATEERYRSIIETTQEGIIILDREGLIRFVNRRFAAMLGYEPDDLYERSVFTLFRDSDSEMVAAEFSRRRAGEVSTREYCFTRRDGGEVWTITAANPLFSESGAFSGSLGIVTDITERKAMELRLATAAAQYQSLAEATPQIVWTAKPDGSFEYVNGRWTEYTGIARAHAGDWGWIPAVHREDVSELLVAWRTALDTGTDFEASLRLLHAVDGDYRWHVMRARALRDGDGAVIRWFGTLTDIHNERRTARQLDIIARTSTLLVESFDRDALLSQLSDFVCIELAHYVLIVLIDENGRLRVAGSSHRDPSAARALRALHGRALLLPQYEAMARARMSLGVTYIGHTGAERLEEVMEPDNCAAIAAAGSGSFVVSPLQARGRTLGAIVAYAAPPASFTDDESAILGEIAARAAIAIENAELYAREHRVSATLQQALLPARLPDIAGISFDAIYEPGATEAQIGGDWYDAVELPDGRIIVSIGDVTGRGLRAAVIMGRVRQAIEALATYQPDPAQLLNAADTVLRRAHPDAIVTALVGVIDLNRRTFAYATAGHPTPIVRARDGTIVTLPGSGLPLGLRDAHQPPTTTIVLPSHALLLLFTDGLVESTRDIDEGERRVMAALHVAEIVDGPHPAKAIKEAVLHDGSSDDVAVFTIRVGDLATHDRRERADSPLRSAWSMHWTFDARDARSTRDVRDLYIAYLRAKGNADADYAAAELVFGELLGNVMRHAPGTVDVEVEWRGDAPVLHVLDRGPGYDRSEKLPHDMSEGGRGLYLVATLTGEFTVTRLPGYGSHARAVLRITRTG